VPVLLHHCTFQQPLLLAQSHIQKTNKPNRSLLLTRRTSTPPPSVLLPAPRARALRPTPRSTPPVSRTVSPTTTGSPLTVPPAAPTSPIPRARPPMLPLPPLTRPPPPVPPPSLMLPPLVPPLPTPSPTLRRPALLLVPLLALLLRFPRPATPPLLSLVVSPSSVSLPLSSLCKLGYLLEVSG
jgi:hypothetical protein